MSWPRERLITVAGTGLLFLVALIYFHKDKTRIFYGDALGYYTYLPAHFIHHSLLNVDDPDFLASIDQDVAYQINGFKYNYPVNDKGNSIIQYTYGTSLMYSLGFFLTYSIDTLSGMTPHGYEHRYQTAIKWIGFLYLLLGLLFTYRSLSFFFKPMESILATAVLIIGTNLLWFTFFQFGMAHVPVFFLFSVLLFFSLRLSKEVTFSNVIVIALSSALITLIRPSDIVCLLIPLIIGGRNLYEQRSAKLFLWLLSGIILALVIAFPQFLYWKKMTGDWLFYSYGEQGFNWIKPKIIDGLFSARNGWFAYTPVMLIASLAFLFLKNLPGKLKLTFLVFIPLYIYIIYAWWCFNYINGFGSRPMIHVYPLMAVGIVAILSHHRTWIRRIGTIGIVLSCLVNIIYTAKAHNGQLFADESTHDYNLAILTKSRPTYNDLQKLDQTPDQPSRIVKENLIKSAVPDTSNGNVYLDSLINEYIYSNPRSEEFPPMRAEHIITPEDLKSPWIKVEVEGRFEDVSYVTYNQHKLILFIEKTDGHNIYNDIRINNKIGKIPPYDGPMEVRTSFLDLWGKVFFYYPTNNLNAGDKVSAYIWNVRQKPMKIKSISLYTAR